MERLHGADTVLVRYGEIGVKSSSVRGKMEARLRDNIDAALRRRGTDGTVERRWSRIIVSTEEPYEATRAACETFGVVSASPCVTCGAEMGAIVETAVGVACDVHDGGSFAVRARRASGGDGQGFTSTEVEDEAGAAVGDELGAPVDLDAPDTTVYIEVRDDDTYVFAEKHDGVGGLPLDTQAPLVALVSGGIDSPVAAWRAMRRGASVVPVYIDLGTYGGADHVARAYEAVEVLARYTPDGMTVWRVPAEEAVETLLDEVDETRMLSYRRFMLRAAEEVARRTDAAGVVTGGCVGQKSSQTTRNLAVVDEAVSVPVHRPLVSFDKTEIVDEARRIGTFRASKVDAGCHKVAPSRPETAANLDDVLAAEPDDLLKRAERAVERATKEEVGR